MEEKILTGNRSQLKGFTIVELLIAIVVIGILAAITIVAYNGIQERATAAVLSSEVKNATTQLKAYHATNENYPASIDDCPEPSDGNLCITPSDGFAQSYWVDSTRQSFTLTASGRGQSASSLNGGEQAVSGQNLLTTDPGERTSSSEFLAYVDTAPIIDKWGLVRYKVSFDIKSADTTNRSVMQVYMQNGSGAKYTFSSSVPVTTSYVRQTVIFTPAVWMPNLSQSMLAFYGQYNTGNIPSVKNVTIELAP